MQLSIGGYQHTTMAQVAGSVGVSRAALNEMYSTKDDLKSAIYSYYKDIHIKSRPDVEAIMNDITTAHPFELLMRLNYSVPFTDLDFTVNTLIMATQILHCDSESLELVKDFTMGFSYDNVIKILDALIKHDRIEPLDTKIFAKLASYYVFSSAVLDKAILDITLEKWNAGFKVLGQLIKVKEGV